MKARRYTIEDNRWKRRRHKMSNRRWNVINRSQKAQDGRKNGWGSAPPPSPKPPYQPQAGLIGILVKYEYWGSGVLVRSKLTRDQLIHIYLPSAFPPPCPASKQTSQQARNLASNPWCFVWGYQFLPQIGLLHFVLIQPSASQCGVQGIRIKSH